MAYTFEQDIPIEKKRFISILRDCFHEDRRDEFERFAVLLEHCFHYQFQNTLNLLYTSYKPFDLSADTGIRLNEVQEHRYAKDLINKIEKLLKQFQYQGLSEYDIYDILATTSQRNFKVLFPMERYQEFLVYIQGEGVNSENRRKLRTLLLKKHRDRIPYYKKLVVLFRPFRVILKKTEAKALRHDITADTRKMTMPQPITLKLFQNIPHRDLPIIYPDIALKIPLRKQLSWLTLFLSTVFVSVFGSLWPSSPWYGLFGIVPLGLLVYKLYEHGRSKKRYYEDLLSHFYYNSLNNNQGVLNYLIEQTEESIYKQILVAFYAFWQRESWAFGEINTESLNSYFSRFFLRYCGVKVKLDSENVLVECGKLLGGNHNFLPPCLEAVSTSRSYLKADVVKNLNYLDIKNSGAPIPRAGVISIAPGTPKEEKGIFFRNPYSMHLKSPLEYSHEAGTAIRYLVEKPFKTRLQEEAGKGSNYFLVSEEDIKGLPLQGIGKVKQEDCEFEFRYYRERNSNRLYLTAGLRYRHVPGPTTPVLVRPVLPSFTLAAPIPKATIEIPLPMGIDFPPEGYVRIAQGTNDDFVTSYVITETLRGSALLTSDSMPVDYPQDTAVSLTPPIAKISSAVSRGAWLIPVAETRNFSKRGLIILSPSTAREERCSFYREAFRLKLDKPLKNSCNKGRFVQIGQAKSKLISRAKRGDLDIMVNGYGAEDDRGTIVIFSGANVRESRKFSIVEKFLYLGNPTKNAHPENDEVWEAVYESPLRYEVFQGSHLIPVENASSFPLAGTLQIHFNKSKGVKEVFPFQRTQCSNTLLLNAHTKEKFKKETEVLITGVEVTTKKNLHYADRSVQLDFSCFPEFPEQGRLIIAPGTQSEEKNVEFSRYPLRLYLENKVKDEHSLGTAVDFSNYAGTVLKKPLEKNTEYISLEYSHLLPTRGSLLFKNGDNVDMLWYRKLPYRVLLEKPCRYPHNLNSRVHLLGVEENVVLATSVSKGAQKLQVINAQELPRKGKIKIQSLLKSLWSDFVREDDILYLKIPIQANFSTRAQLKLPKIFLKSHLSPGSDYLEVSNPMLMPDSGNLLLEKAFHNKMYKQKNRREETINFKYCPDLLWLDNPLEKSYESGTVIFSPELFIKGAGELKMASIEDSQEIFERWLKNCLDLAE